ncbi:MAG: N-formylglutamate amidohydrolase [Candidatus Andersenbacteria bacterium]
MHGFNSLTQRPQTLRPNAIIRVVERDSPLVLSVPHGGTWIPQLALRHVERSRLLLLDTDLFTQKVYGGVAELGSSVQSAVSPYVVNLNRGYTKPENPIIPSQLLSGQATLLKPYSSTERRRLLAQFYHPYQAALHRLLGRAVRRFGFALLLDGHSMDRHGMVHTKDPGEQRADIVLGDNKGTAAPDGVIRAVMAQLQTSGYVVARNTPYSGGHITRVFGRPNKRIFALQIELVKELYMRPVATEFELTPSQLKATAGLSKLRRDLTRALRAGLRAAAVA